MSEICVCCIDTTEIDYSKYYLADDVAPTRPATYSPDDYLDPSSEDDVDDWIPDDEAVDLAPYEVDRSNSNDESGNDSEPEPYDVVENDDSTLDIDHDIPVVSEKTKIFTEKARKVHGDKYVYSKVVYINARTKVIIICLTHEHEFLQNPHSHLQGSGCPIFGKELAKIKKVREKLNEKNSRSFLTNATTKWDDRFDYSKVIYINRCTNIIIICKLHGEFKDSPVQHLKRNNCAGCILETGLTQIKPHRDRFRLNTEEFIKRARRVHGNKYDYSKVTYINMYTRVIIICPIHGQFSQVPSEHLRGYNCYKCGKLSMSRTLLCTQDEFISNAHTVHNYKFDYSQVIYIHCEKDVIIICPQHGPYSQTPKRHLIGKGCYTCARTNRLTQQDFLDRSIKVHGDTYGYSKVVYIIAYSDVIITCKIHGDFTQKPYIHWAGSGCQKCAKVGYSRKAIAWLDNVAETENLEIQHMNNGGEFHIPQTRFKADGYCHKTNTVYEFHGCTFHGCPTCTEPDMLHPFRKIPNHIIYDKTLQREQQIRDLGHNLVVMWEHDWDSSIKDNMEADE